MRKMKSLFVISAVILAVSAGSFTALAAANPDSRTSTEVVGIQTQDQTEICPNDCDGTMAQVRAGADNGSGNTGSGYRYGDGTGTGICDGSGQYGAGVCDGTGTGICDGSGQHGAGVCDGTGTCARDGSCQD